jgi:hypothetical protein
MSFSDDEQERFEQELEDTDVKAILLGIHAELVELRQAVEGSESETETYACRDCGESFAQPDALISHAVQAHNAPPNMNVDFYGTTP